MWTIWVEIPGIVRRVRVVSRRRDLHSTRLLWPSPNTCAKGRKIPLNVIPITVRARRRPFDTDRSTAVVTPTTCHYRRRLGPRDTQPHPFHICPRVRPRVRPRVLLNHSSSISSQLSRRAVPSFDMRRLCSRRAFVLVGVAAIYLSATHLHLRIAAPFRHLFSSSSSGFPFPKQLGGGSLRTHTMSKALDILNADAASLRSKLEAGEVQSVELVTAYLEQIEKHNRGGDGPSSPDLDGPNRVGPVTSSSSGRGEEDKGF